MYQSLQYGCSTPILQFQNRALKLKNKEKNGYNSSKKITIDNLGNHDSPRPLLYIQGWKAKLLLP